jgi:Fic family protein
MDWFLGCLDRAIEGAQATLGAVLSKARFWEAIADFPLNERQRLVLDRLLDDFEGKLTTSKWAKLAKCSQDTALRDILPLLERGVLSRNPAGGRSASYALAKIAAHSDGAKTEPARGEKYDGAKSEKK